VAISPGKASTSQPPPSTASPSPAAPDASTSPGARTVTPSSPKVPQLGGVGMTVMRVLLGFLVAFGTGLIVESQYRRHGNNLLAPVAVPPALPVVSDDDGQEKASWPRRMALISETALHDFVDITVFLILGAILAALCRSFLSHDEMQRLAVGYPALAIV